MRLKARIYAMAAVPLFASLALIAFAVGYQERDLAARERGLVESATMQARRTELRHYLDLALSSIAPLYRSGQDDEETKQAAIRILRTLDYGSDGYFFLYDLHGNNLMHPRQPELVGQNLWDLQDVNGQRMIQDLIEQARNGGGFVEYVWYKPSSQAIAPKLGYVVALPRWNWMLGTGLYLDDIKATLGQLDRQVNVNIATTLWWIAGIAVVGVALIGGSGLVLNLSQYRIADAQLRVLARQVVRSQEDERAHLSRELHDSTSQTLVSIKLLLDSGMSQLNGAGMSLPQSLSKAVDRLNDALREVRTISHRLRPAALDVLGLDAALQQLGEEFAESSGTRFGMQVRGLAGRQLPKEINTVLFRVAQEAFTNIAKHAGARHVHLRLLLGVGGLRLRILDDGRGFDVPAMEQSTRRGIGLRNMRERLASIGGRLHIRSAPGRTQLLAEVPTSSLMRFSPKSTGGA